MVIFGIEKEPFFVGKQGQKLSQNLMNFAYKQVQTIHPSYITTSYITQTLFYFRKWKPSTDG